LSMVKFYAFALHALASSFREHAERTMNLTAVATL
jgi:hypothetical protein